MKSEDTKLMDLLQESEKTKCLTSHYLNLPELSFFHKCNEQYSINRGVYNTIDNWFFEYGIIHVVYRRIYILAFLDYVSKTNKNKLHSSKYIRFGHGGLTSALNSFVTSYLEGKQIKENLYSFK